LVCRIILMIGSLIDARMKSALVNPRNKYACGFVTLLVIMVLVVGPAPVAADIYRYIDENGVMHFTNAPTSSKFKLFMRERKIFISKLDSNQFDPIIADASKKYGLEAPLIKAVIKAESDFDPNAISHKGARGLMQIMPMNFRLLNVENPFDPHQSIDAGARYLRDMMDRYNGKLNLSLAAYNAGPGAVDRHGGVPPYQETEEYIERVMRYYQRYKNS
jgi:soluble lytic murein transglycosylase-like protein